MLPLLCQKFFHLYLAAVPLSADEQRFAESFRVADKFYEANIPLMKKLKKFFFEAESYHRDASLRDGESVASQLHNASSRFKYIRLFS